MDLLYLLYQHGTEVRLLKWDQIRPDGIEFTPTKTENSSGKSVFVPLGQDAKDVLAKAKRIGKQHSAYVIQTEHGRPYTANGIRTLFRRACKRIGIESLTLRDIRAKAATDATTDGYSDAQVQVALAHTDLAMTLRYIKKRRVPVSEVVLSLPRDKAEAASTPAEEPKNRVRKGRTGTPSKSTQPVARDQAKRR